MSQCPWAHRVPLIPAPVACRLYVTCVASANWQLQKLGNARIKALHQRRRFGFSIGWDILKSQKSYFLFFCGTWHWFYDVNLNLLFSQAVCLD